MTHPMQHEDPLAPALVPPPAAAGALRLRYRTGRVVSWSAGVYEVEVDGQVVTVHTVVGGPWVLQSFDRVSLLVTEDSYGTATYLVLGPVMDPAQAQAIFTGGGGVPPGVVAPYAGSAAPAGWLLCDGSAVSRTTYAGLFAVIGTTYGSGDGSTTFNLPDLRGRVPVGRDASQAEFDTLGEAGGAKTHTLTTAEIPAHDHGSAGNHAHNVRYRAGGTVGGLDTNDAAARMFGGALDQSSFFTLSGGAHTHASVGSGQPHNNLQPYRVLNYIIKT